MFGTYFYHETVKRSVSVFGTLFNNVTVKRVKSDDTILQQIKVPIAYGPKQRWLARLNAEPDLNDLNRTAITLPRMGFEMTGINYDATRVINRNIRMVKDLTTTETDGTNPTRGYQYVPSPYNLNFTLSIMARNQEDGLQILEQILPYFQPEYTVAMSTVPTMSDVRDIPIILESVTQQDNYEGDFLSRRILTWDLTFTMKTYFYGPINTGKVITKVEEGIYIGSGTTAFTTSTQDSSGLVKKTRYYEPGVSITVNGAVNDTNAFFVDSIPSNVAAGYRVFGTGNATNPTISSINESSKTITLSANVTMIDNQQLIVVGGVDPDDTYIVAEDINFYTDYSPSTYDDESY
jgi:hypothetical protein